MNHLMNKKSSKITKQNLKIWDEYSKFGNLEISSDYGIFLISVVKKNPT